MEFTERRFTHGGNEYRGKPTYSELRQIAMEMKSLAYSDERTGLLNTRGLLEEFKISKAIFEREDDFDSYTIIALDMIGLHALNDRLGRAEADEVLVNAANSLVRSTRETDLKCRYDGDEFMLVAFNCDAEEARRIINLINDDLPENVKYTIGFKEFQPNSNFKNNINEMKKAVEEVKKQRDHDENGRVVGNGLVVKID